MRAAVGTLNSVDMVKIAAIVQVNREGTTRGTARETFKTLISVTHIRLAAPEVPTSSASAPAPRMRLEAVHNPCGNPNARRPGTFRVGKSQVDGGTTYPARPSPALLVAPPFVWRDDHVPVVSLPIYAAIITYVMSPRAPTPSVANYHRSVPATGTRASSAVPLSQGTISTVGTRALCAVLLGHGPNSAKGTRPSSPGPLNRGLDSATGVRDSSTAPLNHGKRACA